MRTAPNPVCVPRCRPATAGTSFLRFAKPSARCPAVSAVQERRRHPADAARQEGGGAAVPVHRGRAQRHGGRCVHAAAPADAAACRPGGAAACRAEVPGTKKEKKGRKRKDTGVRSCPPPAPAGTQDAIQGALLCLWSLTCAPVDLFEPQSGAAYFPAAVLSSLQGWREPASHPLVKAVRAGWQGACSGWCTPAAASC